VRKSRGFTLIELLVVISIIALLMAILMPALQRVKMQARTVACQSNLKQWSLYFSMYTEDHDGTFQRGLDSGHHWTVSMQPYCEDNKLFYCPTATKHLEDAGQWNNFVAWSFNPGAEYNGFEHGSYGINGFVETNIRQGEHKHWKGVNVKGADYIPLFLDSIRLDGWPEVWDEPPEFDAQPTFGSAPNMRRFCLNRHDGFVNCLFLGWSVRKVGLKELWNLKWHRQWTEDMETTGLPVWPEWMKSFKDY
jgi:prepilin-type N-terminal cleavage/methylation domain-containing protein